MGGGGGGIFCIVCFLMGGNTDSNTVPNGSYRSAELKDDTPGRKLLAFGCAKVLNVID